MYKVSVGDTPTYLPNIVVVLKSMSATVTTTSGEYLSGGTIVILGPTGGGKSQLANYLSGTSFFQVGGRMSSQTMFTQGLPFDWCGSSYVIFDTPGLDDSNGRDTDIVVEMTQKLHDVLDCRGFIYVRNDQQPRMAGSESAVLEHFQKIFGEVFINNLIIVSTRAPPDEVFKKDQGEERRVHRRDRRSDINSKFSELLGTTHEFPKFFIDTSPHCSDDEKAAARNTATSIMTWLVANTPFPLCEMQVVAAKIDSLNAQVLAAELRCDEVEAARLEAERGRLEAQIDQGQAEEEATRLLARLAALQRDLEQQRADWDDMREDERQEWARRVEEANRQTGWLRNFCTVVGGALGGIPGAAIGLVLGYAAETIQSYVGA